MRFFNPKFTVILLLVSVVFFGIPTAPAQAVFLLDDLVNWLLGGILSVENNLLAAVATMMDNVMQPQSLLNQEFIKAGWAITRDFANMFFILILLGVALSFILFPKYQLKSALPRLLVVALLINFSLPIAGVFLDAANILTSFFLSAAGQGNEHISERIANNLNIINVYSIGDFSLNNFDVSAAVFKTSLFAILFIGVLIFIFLAIGVMFIIRNAYLYILLVLLPLALLSYAAGKGGQFSKWTSKFFQWTFFAPMATFFLYLSMLAFDVLITQTPPTTLVGASVPALSQFYNYIVVFVLLIGSLFAAQEMGVKTAGTAMGMLNKAKNATKSVAWRATKAIGREGVYLAEPSASKAVETISKGLAKIPIIGGYAGRATQRAAIGVKTIAEKRGVLTDDEKKAFEKMSDKQKLEYYKNTKKVNASKATTLAQLLAEKGMLSTFDPNKSAEENDTSTNKLKKAAYEDAKKVGNKDAMKAIEKTDHRIFEENLDARLVNGKDPETGNTREEIIKAYYRSFKPGDIEKMDEGMLKSAEGKKFLKNMQIYGNMSGEHLKAALRTNSFAFLEAFEKSIGDMSLQDMSNLKKNNPGIIKFAESNAASQFAGTEKLLGKAGSLQSRIENLNKKIEEAKRSGDAKKEASLLNRLKKAEEEARKNKESDDEEE